MSLPQTDPDRSTLPVAGLIGDDSPAWQALRDLHHLADEGLIDRALLVRPDGAPEPTLEGFTTGLQLLDDLEMHGAYEAHLRAIGDIYTCPAWCTTNSHPRTGICDPADPGIYHAGGERTVDTAEGRAEVWFTVTDEGLAVFLDDLQLTPDQARSLADALIDTADACDQATR